MNEFDINNTDLMQFCKVLKRLELSYQLEKKTEKSKKSETSNKNLSTNESLPVNANKPCLLHGICSHTTDECKVMKEQVQQMKAM